jgi:enoyl-CoA hydratase
LSHSKVITERRGSYAVVRLNRPEKLNALSDELFSALSESFSQLAKEEKLRTVILTGNGSTFSSGTDLAELADADEAEAKAAANRGKAVCDQINKFSVPVIAAVNGIAAGGGCELVLACHLRIASPEAQFSVPEIKLGVIPAYGGTQRLAHEIGRARALEMMLTGRTLSADEALRLGLINEIAESDLLIARAENLATKIAQLAPLAIRACLHAVTKGLELPMKEGLELESELFAKLFASRDMREGTRAFLEKRKAVFNGT